ncbi:lysozyme family protein [Amycolatopsis aidingensis]|uniref:murein transglycosylase n=1 Tax=Amycolatopsis aidingensis TaxID=2842453 RepID=UPI0038CC1878
MGTAITLILTIGVHRDGAGDERPLTVPEQRPEPRAAAPQAALAAPEDRPQESDQEELDAWAARVAEATRVPARVLAAYGRAEMWMRNERPECNLSWGTLAGIGRVESRHGNFGGARIGTDGRATQPIVGVPLDGSPGVREVPDTDEGELDGDQTWDRAVGPLQFLPETWREWGVRATRDSRQPNPQNIDDAAVTAARYLCADGRDLADPNGWWDAVLTYNRSVSYAQDVFSGADAYAAATLPLR